MYIFNHQAIPNDEHQHITMLVLIHRMFENLVTLIQGRKGWYMRPRDHLTPIEESYTNLFKKLKSLNMIETIPRITQIQIQKILILPLVVSTILIKNVSI